MHEAFIPMQRQYTLHTGTAVEKLLCQHGLLTAKVTVSWGGGRRGLDTGWGGMDDGSRAAMKDGGRDVMDVRSPGTSDNAVTALRPSPLPLLLAQIILQGKRIDYLPSVSAITAPPPNAVHLPVSACR